MSESRKAKRPSVHNPPVPRQDAISESRAMIRSVDLYVWQLSFLPRLGYFDLITRWRGRFRCNLLEAKRICAKSVLLVVSSPSFMDYVLDR